MSLEFKSNSTGGGGGETLAQTLVIGNTTGPTDIIQTDASVFRCNDENGLQFASTSGEAHTNAGTAFTTRFNTNSFDILDLAANALFYIRSLASQLYFKIGAELLGNGSVMVIDDDNRISYIDNKDHDIKVGINKDAPTVALDVVGDILINGNTGNVTAAFDDATNTISLSTTAGDQQLFIDGDNSMVRLIAQHIALSGLQDFANNAAALTGGLVATNVYYTNSGGSAVLKIVV